MTASKNKTEKVKKSDSENKPEKVKTKTIKKSDSERVSIEKPENENKKIGSELNEKLNQYDGDTKNEPVTKKRGRPKGSINKKTKEQEKITIPVSLLIGIIVDRMPNPIPLSETERNTLDKTGTEVFNKYIDRFNYFEETVFAGTLLAVIYPRVQKVENNKDKKDFERSNN